MRRELERVLQQVAHGREKHVPVGIHRQAWIDRGNREGASAGLCLECGGQLNIGDEVGQTQQLLARRHCGSQSHLREGAIDETAQPDQAAIQNRAGRPAQPDLTRSHGRHGVRGRGDEVAQFVGEDTQTLVERIGA
ncbi:MAG: hypothetical protein ACHQAR_01475 [Steroidobacterales bacterium]